MQPTPMLHPLSIGEILDRAFRLYRHHFARLLSIPLICLVPMTVLEVISQLLWQTTQLANLLQGLVQLLVTSTLVVAISRAYLGQVPAIGQAYRAGSRRYASAWGASFLMGLAIGVPLAAVGCGVVLSRTAIDGPGGLCLLPVLLAMISFAVFLSTRWSLVLPCIFIEESGAQEGLARSWSLTQGVFWKVFSTSFLANLLVLLIATLPQVAIAYGLQAFMPDTAMGPLIEIIISQAGLILTAPLSTGVLVALYYDLRVRKEGFDIDLQIRPPSTP